MAAKDQSLLVVDDNENNLDMLSTRLERQGYRVSVATSGSQALELLRTQTFDLVLLDVEMPEMDGLEVLSTIRETFSVVDLPVVMVTARDQSGDVIAALQMGANDYITKPLNFPVALARIQNQLAIKRAHAQALTPREPAAPAAPPSPAPLPPAASVGSGRQTAFPPSGSRASGERSLGSGIPPLSSAPPGSSRASGDRSGIRSRTGGDARGERKAADTIRLSDPTPLDLPRIPDGLAVGDYEILGELGRGGMGVVYKARHQRMNRVVALKVIDHDYLVHPHAVRRFYQEVQAAAQLSHPNIVVAYDAGQAGDTHYLAMEYVEGIDLAKLLKKSGPLRIEQAAEYIRQAALGLQHAFERGLVHRDIKPSNLLVTPTPPGSGTGSLPPREPLPTPVGYGVVKILDMGLALLHQPTNQVETGNPLTRDGRWVGTPDYIAPEQSMKPHNVDIRADLYSLGCTFYHLLTGQVPFPDPAPMEKILKHNLAEPVPLERLRPGVPPPLVAVVRRLMAKRPEQRYATPAEVAEALK